MGRVLEEEAAFPIRVQLIETSFRQSIVEHLDNLRFLKLRVHGVSVIIFEQILHSIQKTVRHTMVQKLKEPWSSSFLLHSSPASSCQSPEPPSSLNARKDGNVLEERSAFQKLTLRGERDVPNLHVIKLMQSFKSKEYVRESFAWMYYYWYLTNDGIEYLRTYLNLPSEIVPATLKKSQRPVGQPMGGTSGGGPPRGPRFEGDRPRFGDREGYRGGPPRGLGVPGDAGDKAGAPATFQPSFRSGPPDTRPGFGRGRGGYGSGYGSQPSLPDTEQ